jgi:hypothetical protein
MDKNRMKNMCQKALNIYYSGLTIEEFNIVETNSFDLVDGSWKPDSYTLFIMLRRTNSVEIDYGYFHKFKTNRQIEEFLEMTFGYECCIGFL